MILIEERQTQKVPGETSFFISFDYKPQYIDIIKQFSGINYNKNTKEWEVPLVYLSNLLDSFSVYDSIDLKLLEEKQEKNQIININYNDYKYKPFPYQKEGIEYGLTHNKWLLLFDMGLGKTPVTLYIANELKNQNKINHCLVICGVSSLKNNWRKEIQKFTNLDCIILGEKLRRTGNKTVGSIEERAEQLSKPIKEFFVITNIETLRSEKVQKAILKGPNKFELILLDEIHRIGDPSAQQTQGLLKLKNTKYKIGMTGTLITNTPLNTYAPLKWLDIERSSFTNFKYFYCEFGGTFNNIPIGYKNMGMLKDIIDKHSLRKKKDDPDVNLNLPPKNIINEYVDMKDDQANFYEKIKQGIKDQVDKVNLNTTNLLALSTRLRQATAYPQTLTSENISSAKIDRAIELTEDLIGQDEKVIIFSTFTETVNILGQKLASHSPLIVTGEVPDEICWDRMEEFQNNPNKKLFMGTFAKCSTGFTLTAARYMICMDECWTKAQNDQTHDRIYRIGTTKPVFIYNLITSNTIDEHVHDIVLDKEAISTYLQDGEIPSHVIDRLRKIFQDL